MINNAVDEHIQNQLPIYVLYLKEMKLLRRNEVREHLRGTIDSYIEKCVTEGQGRSSPEALHDLGIRTKEWITKQTAYAILSHRLLETAK